MSGALIGLGIDSVDIGRFRSILQRRPSMAERLFAEVELAYTDTLADPVPSLAGRFAAKEAVMKALGVGLGAFGWHDVAVLRRTGGAPELVIEGRAAKLSAERGVAAWQVSITHTDHIASAVVAAVT